MRLSDWLKFNEASEGEYKFATWVFAITSVLNLVLSGVALFHWENMGGAITHGILSMITAYATQWAYTHYEGNRYGQEDEEY